MPPKKKDDKKKQDDPLEAKYLEEIKTLERAKADMQVEDAFVQDKYRQLRTENERLRADVDKYRVLLQAATQEYCDNLQEKQNQAAMNEENIKRMSQQLEEAQAELAKQLELVAQLKEQNGQQAQRLNDAANLLEDKENLEDAVRKQHDLIEKQSDELRALKRQLEERDSELNKCRGQIEELTLKSSTTTELKILFDDPWMVQITHNRLRGDVPLDREGNSLSALANGKLLALFGGSSRTGGPVHDAVGREMALLNLETYLWDKPGLAKVMSPVHSHTCTVVGRTKLLTVGGVKGDSASSEVAVFNTDTMKWQQPQMKGSERLPPRYGHATCAIREKLFVFGGCSAEGELLNDFWILDQDSFAWTPVTCFGQSPAPRRGASLAATEDGRRLYLFGGFDGNRCLNDVMVLELEKLSWSHVPVHAGNTPEPREDHIACVLSKYLIISGGCAQGGTKRLADLQVLDLYNPRWETLDEGSYTAAMSWLRPRAIYTCFYGNKLMTIKPSMHEKLWELQTIEFALPEDIERLRTSNKRDLGLSDRLELRDDAVIGPTSLEVRWRPPTKNAERIDKYKLMIATGTGVVKDAYLGKDTRFKVIGLKPNTEYILCAKAIYDDGSHIWSESKAYTTSIS